MRALILLLKLYAVGATAYTVLATLFIQAVPVYPEPGDRLYVQVILLGVLVSAFVAVGASIILQERIQQ